MSIDKRPSRLLHRRLRTIIRDEEPVWQLRCPGCEQWADIDDDQLHGRISVLHEPGCGFHETHDWFSEEIGT